MKKKQTNQQRGVINLVELLKKFKMKFKRNKKKIIVQIAKIIRSNFRFNIFFKIL